MKFKSIWLSTNYRWFVKNIVTVKKLQKRPKHFSTAISAHRHCRLNAKQWRSKTNMAHIEYKAFSYTTGVVLFSLLMLVMGNNKAYMYISMYTKKVSFLWLSFQGYNNVCLSWYLWKRIRKTLANFESCCSRLQVYKSLNRQICFLEYLCIRNENLWTLLQTLHL